MVCLWFSSLRDEGENEQLSPWQENERCGKEQGRNEIVGGSAWLSCTVEVMQQFGFGNPISLNDIVLFISNDSD